MKKHHIILYLCLLAMSTSLFGQTTVFGEINTTANINSICTLTSDNFAACGETLTSTLGIILQNLPIHSTCAAARGETMSQIYPSLIYGTGITVDDGKTPDFTHFPTITTNYFIVNCSK